MNLIEDLTWRGLINQCTDIDGLGTLLNNEQVTLYCGFDPTADSLHVGHLIPIISLIRFKNLGHNPISLIGGATGLIGDPSGKSQERDILLENIVINNSNSIISQLSKITQCQTRNNIDWTKNMSVIDFMRKIGKKFSVNSMLARDCVTSRINSEGLSFTEFSYMLFQGNDFLHLNQTEGCKLQIGGSDQFGNMCSGLDLLRKNQLDGFAMTFPLLTKSDGSKFGKSENGSVWLDPTKTSPWDFFQFWLNTNDSDVIQFLKFFTFLSQKEIIQLEELTVTQPHLRLAQKALAKEITTLIHGSESCSNIEEVSQLLFLGRDFNISVSAIELLKKIIPCSTKNISNLSELKQVMVETSLSLSMTKATQSIKENSVHICEFGKSPIKITESQQNFSFLTPFLIRKGKKHFSLII